MFGILYLMIHIPGIVFCKIGVTGKSARKRAKQIDNAVWGFPIPVMIMFVPFPYFWEGLLHSLFSGLRARFYRGDGSTEWFWLPAGVAVFLLGCLYWWWVYRLLISVI